jgi:flagellar assembly factor FliW
MTAMKQSELAPVDTGATVSPTAAEAVVIEFAEPIAGFPGEHTFSLSALDQQGTLMALRSIRTPDLRFVVVAPGRFFPDYAPVLEAHDVSALEVADNDEVQILVIVTVRDSIRDATANLLAPIVVVPGRNAAMQVILSDDRLPLRAPLVAPAR